jgi:nucleoside-diphosphate-sugar epimerase
VCITNEIKIVYLSSWEIYSGYNALGLLACETTPAYPKGTYGLAKAICENLIHYYVDLYALKSLIVRSSTFYGIDADKPKFIYNFLNKALNDEDIIVHKYIDGFPALDLLHIDDLIDFLARSIEKNLNGEYNMGTGVLTSTSAIAKHIIEKTCSKSFLKHVLVEEHSHGITMDIGKAKKDLQYSPKIELEDGLNELINHYKKGLKSEN